MTATQALRQMQSDKLVDSLARAFGEGGWFHKYHGSHELYYCPDSGNYFFWQVPSEDKPKSGRRIATFHACSLGNGEYEIRQSNREITGMESDLIRQTCPEISVL